MSGFLDWRLASAEALKLRKRRGLMVWSAFLTSGVVVIVYVVLAILHSANPAHHGPAGGGGNLLNMVQILGSLGAVAAIMIGATAGSQDISSQVFRELVVTGRSRYQLFIARLRGAVLVFVPLIAASFGLAVLGALVFAGSKPLSSGATIGHAAAWLAADVLVNLTMAVGLGSVLSARITISVLIAWNAIVAPLVSSISLLGSARKGFTTVAISHFDPAIGGDRNPAVPVSTATALLVLLCYAVVFLGLGAWWTQRRDA
jgi:hypothetical protein